MPRSVVPSLVVATLILPFSASAQDSVFLEDLTWMEARAAIDGGATTAIVPTGGTEQNGPHMILGKHNYVVKAAAGAIAERLGNALVAPVVAHVPEGDLDPPSGHMRSAGTITLPGEYFERIVEYTARSLAVHGFTEILLIGDSGGNQAGMAAVAERLNEEWAGSGVTVRHIDEFYGRNSGAVEWLLEQGYSQEDIGSHAGISDTSLLWFVHPDGIRPELRQPNGGGEGSGVRGNPTMASPELGEEIFRIRVDAAVRQVERLRN